MTSDKTVEKILDKQQFNDKTFYLVKWENFRFDQATWELKSNLHDASEELDDFRECHPIERLKKKIKKYTKMPEKRKEYETKLRELQAFIEKLTQQKMIELQGGRKKEVSSDESDKSTNKIIGKKRSRPDDLEPDFVDEEEKRQIKANKAMTTELTGKADSQDTRGSGVSKKEIKEIAREVALKSFLVAWKPEADGTQKQPTYFTLEEMQEKYPDVLVAYYQELSDKCKV